MSNQWWEYQQKSEASELQPPSYYRCELTTVIIEGLAFLFIILFPAITGRYDLYQIVAPIAFIFLLIVWACSKADDAEP